MPDAQSCVIFGYIEDEVIRSTRCAVVRGCHACLYGNFIDPVKTDFALILDDGCHAMFVDLILHVGFI